MSALFDENNNIVSGTLNIGSGQIYDIVLSETSGEPTVFNQNALDIDFVVSGTGIGDGLYYDASTGRLGVNTESPDALLHIVTDCAYDGLKIENNTNCETGVNVLFVHNPQTSPVADSYPVTVNLAGRDTNYSTINYAQIRSKILDPTTGSTSGEIIFNVDHLGSGETVFRSSLNNTILGGLNEIGGDLYEVLGYRNSATGLSYIVVGSDNETTQNTGILIGNFNIVDADNSLVIANSSNVSGDHSVIFSIDSMIEGLNNVGFGSDINITGIENIIIGQNTDLTGDQVVGLLSQASVVGNSGIGFGVDATVEGDSNIHIGSHINISGDNDIAIGSNLSLSGMHNIIYGNYSNVSGNHIVSIGQSNRPQNINSGIYIGNEISLTGSTRSMIIGLGTSTTSGLNDSVLIGINNDTRGEAPSRLVLIGQNNTVSDIRESLVIGNNNDLEGSLANNIIVGPRNNVPLDSNNNLVIGLLNNTSGVVISTDGSIVGTDVKTEGDSMANTNVFGINNWVSEASGALIFGNKSRVNGLNTNSLGSYSNFYGNNIQNIGNSNFVVGNSNAVIGHNNDILGNRSISFNSTDTRNQIFGNDNVILGSNEVIVSGITIGVGNEIYGPDNIVLGRYNNLGHVRYPCQVSGADIVMLGDISAFNGGDKVLVALHSPATQDEPVFVRTILDGVDGNGQPLGIIKNNVVGNSTTLVVDQDISVTNTVDYYIKTTFDDIVHGQDACSECFADVFAGYVSGYVMHYQAGNDDTDLINYPKYGIKNLVLGNNNTQSHMSGIVIGHSNHISGINHIAIGHGISGYFDNTLQIGTNNTNKILLDDYRIVINTGEFQRKIYVNSSAPEAGDNTPTVAAFDLYTNSVGFNVLEPRSTVDVSGTLTTDQLRVGLGTIAGYTLHADNDGNATWDLPVNLSGQNSGMLFMVDENVGSGLQELVFNTGTRQLTYLRADKDLHPTFDLYPGFTEERAVIISQSGMFLNLEGSDYGYDFLVKGSGVQSPVDGDDSIYLIKTIIDDNAIRVHNITGVSGVFGEFTINDGVILPVNLTGTLLRVLEDGALTSQTLAPNSIMFTDRVNFQSTGTNAFRYYDQAQAVTIGLTGAPPLQAEVGLVQGASNDFNNIILGGGEGIDTVFNNAGKDNMFIIVEESNATTNKGFQYDTSVGCLGIGVNIDDTDWQVNSSQDSLRWTDAGKLVVDGKIRAKALQLNAGGKQLSGGNTNKYLKIVDNAGNVGFDTLDLSYQFDGAWPLSVVTNQTNETVSINLAETNSSDVLLGNQDNGNFIVWDGSNWNMNNGLRVVQPASVAASDLAAGIQFGYKTSLNSCANNHAYAAGSFASPGSSNETAWEGSSQTSRFYLRGRTLTDSSTELLADWHKNLGSPSITKLNTISLQHILGQDDHQRVFAWNYTINYVGLANDGGAGFGQVAGELRGSLHSYVDSLGVRQVTKVGEYEVFKQYDKNNSTTFDYGTTDPITVGLELTGDDANIQRLSINANGVNAWNLLWSAVVDIHQVHIPESGIPFGNTNMSA